MESDNHVVLPGYFKALGAKLIKGREPTWEDVKEGKKIVVIDDLLAKKAFKGEDPIGRTLKVCAAGARKENFEVIGVVEHVRQDHPGRNGREQTYTTFALWPFNALYFVTRSSLPASQVADIARKAVHEIDPQLALYDVKTLRGYISQVTSGQRFAMQLLGVFAGLAATLAAIGLYGTIAYTVVQRNREFGVRTALGAGPSQLLALVVKQGLTLATLGIAIGIAAALALSRLLSHLLYGVRPADLRHDRPRRGWIGRSSATSRPSAPQRVHPASVLRSE